MVERQIRARGIVSPAVLRAMESVPRHLFVPPDAISYAYNDSPLPIGYEQTISQPYIVAYMVDVVRPEGKNVLEVGAGSGYAAAVLGELAESVVAIERIPELADGARKILSSLGYRNVEVITGDGSIGYSLRAPYDAVVVSAAAAEIPSALVEQLAPGGRMVIPVGVGYQELHLITKNEQNKVVDRPLIPVAFVPLI